MDIHRTASERFVGLPDFPWEARYIEWQGMRLAAIDEGAGAPVVLFHGEPTWSFLYRKMIRPLLEAGHRCIAPDYPGFGRSDKPTDLAWYSYDRHCEAMAHLLGEFGVEDATFVVQDWGGPIGMRLAVEHPELCSRLVVMNTGLFTGEQTMSDAWWAFRNFVERTEDLPVGFLVKGACASDPSDEIIAGYEAPFDSTASKAGARAFPLLLATSPDAPGAAAGRATAEALRDDARPVLVLWGEQDPVITPKAGTALSKRLGWPQPELFSEASHFLQEDSGEALAGRIIAWLGDLPDGGAARRR